MEIRGMNRLNSIRTRGMKRLGQLRRRISSTLTPGSLILMYHRIIEPELDPWSLCVSPTHFAEHLAVLKQHANPISLQRLNQALQAGQRLPRGVVVTFDDGYVDNFRYAKPLLERYDIPATMFVASGYVGQDREFWWDELEQLILHPGVLPDTLSLTVNGQEHHWQLGAVANYSHDDYKRDRHWSADRLPPPTARHALYISLHRLLRSALHDTQQRLLDELWHWTGTEPQTRLDYRPMTLNEVQVLDSELIEVGAHTVTHPLLAELPLTSQKEELQHNKNELQDWLNRPVPSLAYPYGNYGKDTPELAQSLGFNCACSTKPGSVRPGDRRFQLHRVGVENWNGDEFAKRFSQWLKA